MSLKPLDNQEQLQQTCQIALTVLSDEGVRIPGNALEGIVSFKSLIRAILQGQVVLCAAEQPKVEAIPKPEPEKETGEVAEEGEASKEAA
jgi:hypothetical protein